MPAVCGRVSRVLSPEGDSVDRETIERLQSLSVLRPAVPLTEATTHLRMREEKVNSLPQLASWLHIEGYNVEKRK